MRAAIALVIVLVFVLAPACNCGGEALSRLHPVLVASANRLDLGDVYVGGQRTLPVTLTSAGTAPVELSGPTLDGAPFAFATALGAELRPGENADVAVTFTPLAAGPAAGSLRIESDAENAPVLSVELAGTGLAPLDCDDHESCTDDAFDANGGVCVHTNRTGACDDASACTANDRCLDGACVGDAVTCADTVACTRDVCDPAVGCAFIPDDAACADADPCSLDVCDVVSGCAHPPAPDGHPCGAVVQCASIDLCIAHVCTPFPIPDGAPCSDGDVCTAGDACAGGACVGVPSTTPPGVLSETTRLLLNPLAVLVGDTLIAADVTAKLVPLAPPVPAPTASLPAIVEPVALAVVRDGRHVAALTLTPAVGLSDGATFHAIVTDVGTAASLDVALPDAPFLLLGASSTHVFVCSNVGGANGLSSIDVATRTLTALPGDGLCDAAQPSFPPAFDGVTVLHGLDVWTLDAAGAVHAATAARPAGVTGTLLHTYADGARGAVTNSIDEQVVLVDVDDPTAPVTAAFDPRPAFGVGAYAVGMSAPFLYFVSADGFRRVDVSAVAAPVVDAWGVDVPLLLSAFEGFAHAQGTLLAVDARHAALTVESFDGLRVVDTSVATRVRAPLIGGQGAITYLVDDGAGVLGVSRVSVARFDDAALADPTVPGVPMFVARPAIVEHAPGGSGLLFTPLLIDSSRRFVETGALPFAYTSHIDGRAALALAGDPHLQPGRFTLHDDGTLTSSLDLSVAAPVGAVALSAVAVEGCTGAALESFADDAADRIVTLSICDAGADVVQLSASLLLGFAGPVTGVASSPTTVTFLGSSQAVLLDIANPTAPALFGASVPELLNAAFADAGADAGKLLIVASAYGAPSQAALFDLTGVDAIRLASWDLPGGDDVRRRVLAVRWPRAYLSEHAVNVAPERGWSVVAWDLSAFPPAVTDVLPIESEPVDVVVRNDQLVVGRSDGLTVIAPPCGP